MATKPQGALGEGDTVGLTGEVSIVHDDGKVTVWLKGYDIPVTIRAEHLSLIQKGADEAEARQAELMQHAISGFAAVPDHHWYC